MAAGWKEAYDAGKCEKCGKMVQRRKMTHHELEVLLDVHTARRANVWRLMPDGTVKPGRSAGEGYPVHRC